MKVQFDPDTGAITNWGTPGRDYNLYAVDITTEQLVGATVERRRKGGKPLAIRLADDTIVEEVWPPPNNYLYHDGPEPW